MVMPLEAEATSESFCPRGGSSSLVSSSLAGGLGSVFFGSTGLGGAGFGLGLFRQGFRGGFRRYGGGSQFEISEIETGFAQLAADETVDPLQFRQETILHVDFRRDVFQDIFVAGFVLHPSQPLLQEGFHGL